MEKNIDTLYPINQNQYDLIKKNLENKNSLSFNHCAIFELSSDVTLEKIKSSIQMIYARHISLRSYFNFTDGIKQQIAPLTDLDIPLYEVENMRQLKKLKKELNQPFDLSRPPLVRFALILLNKNYYLFGSIYRGIIDVPSILIFLQEFADLCSDKTLKPLKMDSIDQALIEKNDLETGALQEKESFWLDLYDKGIPVTNIPYDKKPKKPQIKRGKKLLFSVEKELVDKVKKLSKNNNTVSYSILLTTFAILLSCYTGKQKMSFLTPYPCRTKKELARSTGVFMQYLPFPVNVDENKTFSCLSNEVEEIQKNIIKNQDYPLALLKEKLQDKLDCPQEGFDNIIFSFLSAYGEAASKNMKTNLVCLEEEEIYHDLIFRICKMNKSFFIELTYNGSAFHKTTVQYLGQEYLLLLKTLISKPELTIKEIYQLAAKYLELYYADNDRLQKFLDRRADLPAFISKHIPKSKIDSIKWCVDSSGIKKYCRKHKIKPRYFLHAVLTKSIYLLKGTEKIHYLTLADKNAIRQDINIATLDDNAIKPLILHLPKEHGRLSPLKFIKNIKTQISKKQEENYEQYISSDKKDSYHQVQGLMFFRNEFINNTIEDEKYNLQYKGTPLDFYLLVYLIDDKFLIDFKYDKNRYDRNDVLQFLQTSSNVAEKMIDSPNMNFQI